MLSDLKNYQSAANEFREALGGDLLPGWVAAWSHVRLGVIFDATGQRNRAVNEYNQALRTGDNASGALDEASRRLNSGPLSAPPTPREAVESIRQQLERSREQAAPDPNSSLAHFLDPERFFLKQDFEN